MSICNPAGDTIRITVGTGEAVRRVMAPDPLFERCREHFNVPWDKTARALFAPLALHPAAGERRVLIRRREQRVVMIKRDRGEAESVEIGPDFELEVISRMFPGASEDCFLEFQR